MRTPRVSVPGPVRAGERVELPLEEGHHLASVLRRSPGDAVIILAESGGAFRGVISGVGGDGKATRVIVAVVEAVEQAGPPVLPWAVAVAVVRGDAFDLAVRMAAELGLEAVLPLLTERTMVRGAGASKEERWRRTAREAAKQCGRGSPLGILRARTFEEVVGAWSADRSLPADFPGGPPRRAWVAVPGEPLRLEDLLGPGGHAPAPAIFIVGPEGGLTPGEVARASVAGWEPLGLPVPVLRTPTAVALLGALGAVLRSGAPPFPIDSPGSPP